MATRLEISVVHKQITSSKIPLQSKSWIFIIESNSSFRRSFPCPLALQNNFKSKTNAKRIPCMQMLASAQLHPAPCHHSDQTPQRFRGCSQTPIHTAEIQYFCCAVVVWACDGCLIRRKLLKILLDEGADEGLHALLRAHRAARDGSPLPLVACMCKKQLESIRHSH
jgi:hypothetical protein